MNIYIPNKYAVAIDLKDIKKTSHPRRKSPGKEKNKAEGTTIMDFLNRDITFFGKKLKDKKKESFYSELGVLLSSGIDIRTSFDIIVEEQKKANDKKIFDGIRQKIVEGESLSEAMQGTGKFTTYEYFSIRIGEESGKLNAVLEDLTDYYSKKIKQKRKLSGAFTYPVMVITTAILAVIFMMNFIVPMFVDVFKRFQGNLPPLTKKIMNISEFFQDNLGVLALLVIGIIAFILIVKKKRWYRRMSSFILLRLPVFGAIVNKIYLSRFCQAMALLIGSKTPMIKTIQLTRNMIRFYPFEKALDKIENDILHGKLLHESMEQFPVFNKRIISLTKVAEEVNKLDEIFRQLNKQYSEELEHQIGMINNLLEPFLIIGVGLLVAVILIAMYLPLFQLSTSIF